MCRNWIADSNMGMEVHNRRAAHGNQIPGVAEIQMNQHMHSVQKMSAAEWDTRARKTFIMGNPHAHS